MGEIPTYIFWCVIAPIGVGIILALLSLPLSLIGGAIYGTFMIALKIADKKK